MISPLISLLKRIKSPQFEKEAERIKNAWLELDGHPVLKAVVLERSVFFVLLPIFRFLGDTGLRTTSTDISTRRADPRCRQHPCLRRARS